LSLICRFECFINHTYVMDEFSNKATFQNREPVSAHIEELEETYDETHPDFIIACELKKKWPGCGQLN
jgi:hypothetical protein